MASRLLGDNALRFVTIEDNGNGTWTATRHPSGDGGDATTVALYSRIGEPAADLLDRLVLGNINDATGSRRGRSTNTVTFKPDATWSEALQIQLHERA